MTQSTPKDGTYDDAMERIARVLADEQETLEEIRQLGETSFRVWLDEVAQRVAHELGMAVAAVRAYIDDILAIGSNMAKSFRDGFREGYESSRRVLRRK